MKNTEYGIRKICVSINSNEFEEYGIRKAGDQYIALCCGAVGIYRTLNGAKKCLQKMGIDAFGNPI